MLYETRFLLLDFSILLIKCANRDIFYGVSISRKDREESVTELKKHFSDASG